MNAGNRSSEEIDRYFRAAVALKGSKLLLTVGEPPRIEIDGTIKTMNRPAIDFSEMESLALPVLSDRQMHVLKRIGHLTFDRWVEKGNGKHRFNVEVRMNSGILEFTAVQVFD